MALRRRLSPGLPLSHTSGEGCDPAVLFLAKCSPLCVLDLASLFFRHMGDDCSVELSQREKVGATYAARGFSKHWHGFLPVTCQLRTIQTRAWKK